MISIKSFPNLFYGNLELYKIVSYATKGPHWAWGRGWGGGGKYLEDPITPHP